MRTKQATVIDVIEETHDAKTLRLKIDPPIEFLPGQWISLLVTLDGQLYRRPYSIGSAPHQKDYVDITFKLYADGKVTPFLFTVEKDHVFDIIGPFGRFVLNEQDTAPVFIAAGSGIVPLMSMLRHAKDKMRCTLLYSNKKPQDIIYGDELDQLAQEGKLTFHPVITQDPQWDGISGRLDQDKLANFVKPESTFYICGPAGFVADVEAALIYLGVVKDKIKVEEYD